MVENISPKVHRSLYNYSVKNFIEKNVENIHEFIEKYQIDVTDELGYSRLLDSLINYENLNDSIVDEFLLDELNYGRSKNVYVSFIQNIGHLKDEDNILKCINKLQEYGYVSAGEVESFPFTKNLRRGVNLREDELIWCDINKNSVGIPSHINLLFAQGRKDLDSHEYNYYIGIEINLIYKFLIIKLRNNTNDDLKMDRFHITIQNRIKDVFNLEIPLLSSTSKKLVYNMIDDLSGKVLNQTINTVDRALKDKINDALNDWMGDIFSDSKIIPTTEYDVLSRSLLNNYYRLFMQIEYGNIKNKDLKEKFNVAGYPRYVKFNDDAIGEARAKSGDPKESLLDTSVYYDLRARLDQSKLISMATIYWIAEFRKEPFGITFYTESHEHFKFIALANFFDKRMCDYVLQQISEYYPRS